MNLIGIELSTALTLAGALSAALAILYLLKLRRRRVTVPFTNLWSRVLMDKDATSWLQRLKRLLSLLLWIIIMLLLVVALTDPQPEEEIVRGRNILLAIDTSASMAAREGGKPARTRFDLALEQANTLIDELGSHDKMMILAVDGQVRSVTGDFTDNVATLHTALEGLKPSATEANVMEGLRTAVDTLIGRKEPHLIFISDGAHPTLLAEARDQRAAALEEEAALAGEPESETEAPTEEAEGDESGAEGDEGEGVVAGVDDPAAGDKPGVDASDPDAAGEEEEVDAAEEAPEPRILALPEGMLRAELTFEHILVGKATGNIAVTGFNIRRYLSNKLDYEVYVQVRNFFDQPVHAELTLFNLIPDDTAPNGFFYKDIEKRTLNLGPGSQELRFYKNLPLASDHLAVRVELKTEGITDALPMDNEAFVLVPSFKQATILVVTAGNLFLEAALLLNENFTVDIMEPDDPFLHPGGNAPITLTGLRERAYDVVVFDNSGWEEGEVPVTPAPTIDGNYLYINPRGEDSPFSQKAVKEPLIERVDRKHPIARWLVMKELNILRGVVMRAKRGDRVVARAIEGPIILARRDGASNLVGIGFSFTESDIVFRVALPVLLINTVDWFMDESNSLIKAFHTGENWHVPVPSGLSAVDIADPLGNLDHGVPTHEGKVVYYGAHTGFYTISPAKDVSRPAGTPDRWEIAANFSAPPESEIAPADEPLPSQEGASIQQADGPDQDPRLSAWSWILDYAIFDIWLLAVFAVLGLLLLEWLSYHRRWTV